MPKAGELIDNIQNGSYDAVFSELYGGDAKNIQRQRGRYINTIRTFCSFYGDERELAVYSTPGRTEIGGNHTDHQRGKVLAAAVNLDIIAVVAKNKDNTIRVRSQGFEGEDAVLLEGLEPKKEEAGRSLALVRGVAAGVLKHGGQVGGFDAFTTSDVLKGSGLSSSAAFEVCLGAVLNGEYNNGRLTPVQLGIIGQYAENVFFGKPSGLMDQTACAVGSAIAIDFEDPENPLVRRIPFDLAATGYSMVITDTKGDHANLTAEYAAIRTEMEEVAAFFGKQALRQVDEADFLDKIAEIREKTGDRAVLRAIHFFADSRRAGALADALERRDFDEFLRLIVAGGHSSFEYNQNAYAIGQPQHQGVSLALALSQQVLQGRGAWRLQGGGFAGTIQAFVPADLLDTYTRRLGGVFGRDACHILTIRPAGSTRVLPAEKQ